MIKRAAILMIGMSFMGLMLLGSEKTIFPWRTYDSKIPTPTEFFGYEMGGYHTTYSPMVQYFQELTKASQRIRFNTYGKSYECRNLYYAVVSSEDNMMHIEEIKKNISRLSDPDQIPDKAEVERIIETTPAVVFLNFGNHGNESAAFESSIHDAYQLVAGTDEVTKSILEKVVVVITPAMNPDCHERFVAWYNASQVGKQGTADPNADEHFAPWGMDTTNNHYQINLNRESVWSTQTENQALVRLYHAWNPQVFVDHHGQPVGFIGPGYAEPLDTEITSVQREWFSLFEKDMAEMFKEHGFPYTPWEFGTQYPGYWDSYPLLNGAIAFTTESGGGGWKGLQLRLAGGHITTLKHGILQNLIADQAVLRVAAMNRGKILSDYLNYKQKAVEQSKNHSIQAYAISASNDPQRLDAVVNLLIRNGIKVFRSSEPFRVRSATSYFPSTTGPRSFRKNSCIIPMVQPQSRLLRVLMEPDTKISKSYLDQVKKARKLSETPGYINPNIWITTEPFYDVTAWALPLTYNIESYMLPQMPQVEMEQVMDETRTPGRLLNLDAKLAYAFDYTSNRALSAISKLRQKGIKFRIASSPFRIDEFSFVRGSIVIFSYENKEMDLPIAMQELVDTTGVTILGVDRNLVDEGPHFGSDQYLEGINKPIAVLRGGPIRPSSFGSIWYLFERVYDVPFTAVDFKHLLNIDLKEYGVIIFPDGFYTGLNRETEKRLVKKLRRWIIEGGSLVGIKGASAWLAKKDMGLTKVRTTDPYVSKSIYMTDGGHPPLPVSPPEENLKEVEPEAASMEQLTIQDIPIVPGAIFRAKVYPYHFLSYGYPEELPVLVWSNLAFSADNSVGIPVSFDIAKNALVAGFAFPDSVARLAGTPYLMDEKRGLGHVILFADDPNFRLYWDGLTRLFFNSVFFSNSF